MKRVAVSGYSIVKPSRGRKDKGEDAFTTEQYQALALSKLLQNTGLERKDLETMKFGVGLNRPMWPHAMIWSSEVMANLGLSPGLTFVSDHGGAAAFFSMIQAYLSIASGRFDHFLLIGADSPMIPAPPQSTHRPERTWRYEINYEMPIGMIGPLSEGAMIMKRHMHQYGTTGENLAEVAIAARNHALLNPNAYLKKPLTVEEYMKSPVIATPMRVMDAVIPVNGGYAMLISSEEEAGKLTDKPVYIKGFETALNTESKNELRDITDMRMKNAADSALEQAGISRKEVDFLQLYDDFTIITLMQLEALGFAEKGKGGKFLESNDISFRGDLPVNTGGGQLSGGQAGTAGGFSLFVEAIQQLRGEAEGRQIKDCRNGLVTGLGGLGYNSNLLNKGVMALSN